MLEHIKHDKDLPKNVKIAIAWFFDNFELDKTLSNSANEQPLNSQEPYKVETSYDATWTHINFESLAVTNFWLDRGCNTIGDLVAALSTDENIPFGTRVITEKKLLSLGIISELTPTMQEESLPNSDTKILDASSSIKNILWSDKTAATWLLKFDDKCTFGQLHGILNDEKTPDYVKNSIHRFFNEYTVVEVAKTKESTEGHVEPKSTKPKRHISSSSTVNTIKWHNPSVHAWIKAKYPDFKMGQLMQIHGHKDTPSWVKNEISRVLRAFNVELMTPTASQSPLPQQNRPLPMILPQWLEVVDDKDLSPGTFLMGGYMSQFYSYFETCDEPLQDKTMTVRTRPVKSEKLVCKMPAFQALKDMHLSTDVEKGDIIDNAIPARTPTELVRVRIKPQYRKLLRSVIALDEAELARKRCEDKKSWHAFKNPETTKYTIGGLPAGPGSHEAFVAALKKTQAIEVEPEQVKELEQELKAAQPEQPESATNVPKLSGLGLTKGMFTLETPLRDIKFTNRGVKKSVFIGAGINTLEEALKWSLDELCMIEGVRPKGAQAFYDDARLLAGQISANETQTEPSSVKIINTPPVQESPVTQQVKITGYSCLDKLANMDYRFFDSTSAKTIIEAAHKTALERIDSITNPAEQAKIEQVTTASQEYCAKLATLLIEKVKLTRLDEEKLAKRKQDAKEQLSSSFKDMMEGLGG